MTVIQTPTIGLWLVVLASLAFGTTALAEEGSGQGSAETEPAEETQAEQVVEEMTPDDEVELRRLLEILDKHTEIATKTKLNADYVPGMVTVLYGDDLEARGIRTVWEALGLVPGMELFRSQSGVRQVLARRFGRINSASNVKFLLDGVPIYSLTTNVPRALLGLTVQQIERIEVVRGPGSAVHGEFAGVGVVNFVTHRDENRIFGETGSHDTYSAGGTFSWRHPDSGLRLGMMLAGMDTDGPDEVSGPDRLHAAGQGAISNAPGPANEDRRQRTALLSLDFNGLSLQAGYLEAGNGDFFGSSNVLPFPQDRIVSTHSNWLFDTSYSLDVAPQLKAGLHLSFLKSTQDTDRSMNNPPGFTMGPFTYPDGQISSLHYEETRVSGGVDLTWKGIERHTIRSAVEFSSTEMGDDVWREANFDPDTFEPLPSMQRFEGDENWIREDQGRQVFSISFQDEFALTDGLTLTGSLRYDRYDDIDNHISPRLAAVWRPTGGHVFKVQYTRSFRPPMFLEMFINTRAMGNQELDHEKSDTYELGYVHRRDRTVLRMNLFHVKMKDLIGVDRTIFQFNNIDVARSTGLTLEVEHTIGTRLKFDTNVTFTDTDKNSTGEELRDGASWLANAGVLYEPIDGLLLNAQYRYVGQRHRAVTDTRVDLDAYHTVDLTASLLDLLKNGLTLRVSIKNLFDEDVRYPAPMNTYPEDYPRPGREWWLGASYEF